MQHLGEEIVTCPKCGQKNRLHKRSSSGIYTCGLCGTTLADPFASRKIALILKLSKGRWLILAAAAVFIVIGFAHNFGKLAPLPTSSQVIPNQSIRQPDSPRIPAAPPTPQVSACPPNLIKRPVSGAELGGHYSGGLGLVRIINGTASDAAAVLVQAQKNIPVRSIYIRSHESGLITKVPAGTYSLRFQFGSSWRTDRKFCEISGTSVFEENFDFNEKKSEEGVHYMEWEVTLNPVPQGTARTQKIPDATFVLPPE